MAFRLKLWLETFFYLPWRPQANTSSSASTCFIFMLYELLSLEFNVQQCYKYLRNNLILEWQWQKSLKTRFCSTWIMWLRDNILTYCKLFWVCEDPECFYFWSTWQCWLGLYHLAGYYSWWAPPLKMQTIKNVIGRLAF